MLTMRLAVPSGLLSWPMAWPIASGPSSGAKYSLMPSMAVRYSKAMLLLPACSDTCSDACKIWAFSVSGWPWGRLWLAALAWVSASLAAGDGVVGWLGARLAVGATMVFSCACERGCPFYRQAQGKLKPYFLADGGHRAVIGLALPAALAGFALAGAGAGFLLPRWRCALAGPGCRRVRGGPRRRARLGCGLGWLFLGGRLFGLGGCAGRPLAGPGHRLGRRFADRPRAGWPAQRR